MESPVARRLTVLDAIVLVGATALGLVRLPEAWPEAWEVFRRVDLSHLRDDTFPWQNFNAMPQTGRMDSIGRMSRDFVRAFSGLRASRMRFRKPDGSLSTYEEGLESFGLTRTYRRSGGRAAGYAAAGEAYVLAFPFLIVWTISLLILRLRRSRPEPALLWRQPGWCGCVAAVAGAAAGLLEEAVVEWPAPTVVVPAAVMIAWLALLITRRWSAEASWIDRAGRCLGLAWIAMIQLFVVGFVLPYFR
jgi:hypothetical protein